MSKKKLKKLKFASFKHFETAMMLKRIKPSVDELKDIPYYRMNEDEKGHTSLNVFNEKGTININKVKFVKRTVPKKAIDELVIAKCYKKKVKVTKPEEKFQSVEGMVGFVIPIKLFEYMIMSMPYVVTPKHLSYLLHLATTADAIKLLDKEEQCIAYLIPDFESFY